MSDSSVEMNGVPVHDGGEQLKDKIARATRVSKMLLELQDRILVKKVIEHRGRFAFRWG